MLFGHRIMGLDGCELLDTIERTSTLIAKAIVTAKQTCPHCKGTRHRIKSTQERKLRHGEFESKILFIHVRVRKYFCLECKRYFRDRIPGVKERFHASESFKNRIFTIHEAGASCKTLAKMMQVSENTISRWVGERLHRRLKELSTTLKNCPKQLGIDEHFFSKKHGFATTLVDLKNKRVFDVVLGRSENSLEGYFRRLSGKENVNLVVMDLSDTYKQIVQKFFPNAQIISDRFHVIRLVFQHFQKVWHSLDPQVKWKRGLGKLFRMHPKNLDFQQKTKLDSYLNQHPAIQAIHEKRTEVCELLLKKDQRGFQLRAHIKSFFRLTEELQTSGFESLKTLSKTLLQWQEEIGRMWRCSKNNGITEGFHNKMEVISRRAYGYRNFYNYRCRVLAMSGWDGVYAVRRPQQFVKLQI